MVKLISKARAKLLSEKLCSVNSYILDFSKVSGVRKAILYKVIAGVQINEELAERIEKAIPVYESEIKAMINRCRYYPTLKEFQNGVRSKAPH